MAISFQFCIPSNPILKSLRMHGELNLGKLRSCRNIEGMKVQAEVYSAATDAVSGMPVVGSGGQLLLPGISSTRLTPYRFATLIERAKQFAQYASQVEAALWSIILNRDAADYTVTQAKQQLTLAHAGLKLQDLRITEAKQGVKLAALQQARAQIQINTYDKWIVKGANEYEILMINAYQSAATAQIDATNANRDIQMKQSVISSYQLAAQIGSSGNPWAIGAGIVAGAASTFVDAILFDEFRDQTRNAINATLSAQFASIDAALERKKDEWNLQKNLAEQDFQIGELQITIADEQVLIVTQEKAIAVIQADNAKDTVAFLSNQFGNVERLDLMINILKPVFKNILQRGASNGMSAQNHLAFERQEPSLNIITSDYWEIPETTASFIKDGKSGEWPGLTGSARLLRDILELDQQAFNTNKRKLQLTKIISLAGLLPAEFNNFRDTGVLIFTTPMEMFDRDFPGHYLRLIHRVRTSIIALIPPTQGIHATLTCSGISRTVIGPDIFQTIRIRRDPESVALTSPINATGLFELDPISPEMLLPFEGNGIDTTFEFSMPKASNQFDYRTIADVLITIEYTALSNVDYRQQVIQNFNPTISFDWCLSLKNQYDQWYDLTNPELSKTPMTVRVITTREDFRPNLENLQIQHLTLLFILSKNKTFDLPLTTLRFNQYNTTGFVEGTAAPIDGSISTRNGNGSSLASLIGKFPFGLWELALPDTEYVRKLFSEEVIQDILLVITYSGRTPEWPS